MTTLPITERLADIRCCDDTLACDLTPAHAQQLSDDLQILGHPVRLQILTVLARHAGRVCVCDIESAVPVKQPTVSHHLKLLREAGLVDAERQGQWMYYFVKREAFAALRGRIANHLALLDDAHE